MTKRAQFEFRTNGIRLTGDVFNSWSAAADRMFRELNRLHFELAADRDHNGRQESEWIATHARMKRESPRPNVLIRAHRNGKPWTLEVRRLPY